MSLAAAFTSIVQLAFFGAAGTSFIAAHLKNQAMSKVSEGAPPSDRWRVFRFPHLAMQRRSAGAAHRRAAVRQTVWGFVFMLCGFAAGIVFQIFPVGA